MSSQLTANVLVSLLVPHHASSLLFFTHKRWCGKLNLTPPSLIWTNYTALVLPCIQRAITLHSVSKPPITWSHPPSLKTATHHQKSLLYFALQLVVVHLEVMHFAGIIIPYHQYVVVDRCEVQRRVLARLPWKLVLLLRDIAVNWVSKNTTEAAPIHWPQSSSSSISWSPYTDHSISSPPPCSPSHSPPPCAASLMLPSTLTSLSLLWFWIVLNRAMLETFVSKPSLCCCCCC